MTTKSKIDQTTKIEANPEPAGKTKAAFYLILVLIPVILILLV